MNKLTKNILFFTCALIVFLMPIFSVSAKQEEILNFDSEITINSDSTLKVTETIKVNALGQEIKRGIYRDFPTKYKDRLGNNYSVGFKILEVLRGGQTEDYHTEKLSNGVRIYFGNENYFLPAGEYTYTLKYETNRQLGFFEDHDELYWNVTGQGWIFPINSASAKITFPAGVAIKDVDTTAYTGPQGSTNQNYSVSIKDNSIIFFSTKPLKANEGLTIVASWPKGFVAEPTLWQKIIYVLKDNLGLLLGGLGLLAVIIYYLLTWIKVGRDPKADTIIPQYDPPQNMSPAETRYLTKMGFDNKALVSQIIAMAIKGMLNIKKEKAFLVEEHYLIKKEAEVKDARPEEKQIFNALFYGDTIKLRLKNENYKIIQAAKKSLQDHLDKKIKGSLFKTNYKKISVGFAVSLSIFILVVALPNTSVFAFIFAIILMLINFLFIWLLKAPTQAGRQILDQLEGFKWFLTVTEKDRLNFHNPPDKTPELFEKFLPYALALGVEHAWSKQFTKVFDDLEKIGRPYQPAWFVGTNLSALNTSAFTNSLSKSFSNAISSSSHAPGSNSGMGGGGFSGGGGGGGGGGGW